jgi:Excalibur calcium-binding domain
MRVRTTAAAIVLAAVATLPLAGIANAQWPDRDCDDFATQQKAQAAFDDSSGDPYRLDEDNDGKACEWLPSVSSTTATISGQVRSVPQGGLDTGDGTMAEGTGSEVLVTGGLILAGGLAVAVLRRRTARRSS